MQAYFLFVYSLPESMKPYFFFLRLHGTIYLSDYFILMLRYCVNLKLTRYESTSLNRIVTYKSHCVIVALFYIYRWLNMWFTNYPDDQTNILKDLGVNLVEQFERFHFTMTYETIDVDWL